MDERTASEIALNIAEAARAAYVKSRRPYLISRAVIACLLFASSLASQWPTGIFLSAAYAAGILYRALKFIDDLHVIRVRMRKIAEEA